MNSKQERIKELQRRIAEYSAFLKRAKDAEDRQLAELYRQHISNMRTELSGLLPPLRSI